MSHREKLLGIVVACLLGMFALFGAYRAVNAGLQNKRDTLAERSRMLRAEKSKNLAAKRDQIMVAEYQRRSLPAKTESANRGVKAWGERMANTG